jgi:hypothetical protein
MFKINLFKFLRSSLCSLYSCIPLELLKYYVPLDATFFVTLYDDWGKKKLEGFRSVLLNVEVLWKSPLSEKGISGDSMRRRIVEGKRWEELAPESTRHLIQAWDIPACLRKLLHEQEQQLRQVP